MGLHLDVAIHDKATHLLVGEQVVGIDLTHCSTEDSKIPAVAATGARAARAPPAHGDHHEQRIYVARQLYNPEFASAARSAGLAQLATLARVEEQPRTLTAEHAGGVVAVIADSAPFRDDFYAAARDLRVVARWGVGFDQVNVAAATRHGVPITVTPVHMDTVAEYTIGQWFATMKRTHTLNRNAHADDTRVLRCFDVRDSTLGLYGFGRIGQEVALRALPLLGPGGRLLVYDTRPDIEELALRCGVVAVIIARCAVPGVRHGVAARFRRRHHRRRRPARQMQPHASLINPSRGKPGRRRGGARGTGGRHAVLLRGRRSPERVARHPSPSSAHHRHQSQRGITVESPPASTRRPSTR